MMQTAEMMAPKATRVHIAGNEHLVCIRQSEKLLRLQFTTVSLSIYVYVAQAKVVYIC